MSAKKLIVVIGATGWQGGSVVNTFLADPSWTVRAVTRSPSGSKAQALRANGAEVVQGDLNDSASLKEACKGAHVIFGVTDYWSLFADESIQAQVKPGQTINELCFDLEIQQGKNIFDAAASVPNLERLVYSSLPNTKRLSGGKYTKIYHFEAKALGAEYGEKTHPDLWAKTSVIQLGFYLSNLSTHPFMSPTKNVETGAYEFVLPVANSSFAMVATETDTGALVKALVAADPGKNLLAYRERMDMNTYAELWSRLLNVQAKVNQGRMKGIPPPMYDTMDETFAWALEYGMFGEKVDKSLITPKELDPSLDLGTTEGWIKAQDWSHLVK